MSFVHINSYKEIVAQFMLLTITTTNDYVQSSAGYVSDLRAVAKYKIL